MPVPNMRNCKVGRDPRTAHVTSPIKAGKKYATRGEGETSESDCSATVGYMPCQISLRGPHASGRLAAAVALNGWEALQLQVQPIKPWLQQNKRVESSWAIRCSKTSRASGSDPIVSRYARWDSQAEPGHSQPA
jgi:hypothetical protein